MPEELIIAFGLVLVIEGGLYALFPGAMRKMAKKIEMISSSALRNFGLFTAILGVGLIWFIRG